MCCYRVNDNFSVRWNDTRTDWQTCSLWQEALVLSLQTSAVHIELTFQTGVMNGRGNDEKRLVVPLAAGDRMKGWRTGCVGAVKLLCVTPGCGNTSPIAGQNPQHSQHDEEGLWRKLQVSSRVRTSLSVIQTCYWRQTLKAEQPGGRGMGQMGQVGNSGSSVLHCLLD